MAATGLTFAGASAMAQNSPAATTAPAVTVSKSVPPLAYGVSQILQLTQAKIGEDTIIAYIKNSGNSYGLNADQIIYLRQQGVADAVLTAMLSQPRAGVAIALPTTPAPQLSASTAYAGQVSTATVAPAVTYVQTVPDTTDYSVPYYDAPYYYYPDYAWYPPVTFNYGWGGGWRGGWHGGGSAGGGHGGGRR